MPLAPFFSNSASDWTAQPGLYISERNTPGAFVGRLRNSVGVCGECVRGPVGTPISITDAAYFLSVFGARDQGGPISDGNATITGLVWQSLLNKKFGEVVVIRAAAAAAVAASKALTSTGPVTNLTVTAANVGVWGNNITVAVEAASNAVSTSFDLVLTYVGATYRLKNININGASDDNTATVLAEMWPDPYQRLVTLTKGTAGRPDNAVAAALTSGAAGSIADSDFTGTGGPMEQLAAYAGLKAVWIAERTHSTTLQDKWETLAASAYDRFFLVGASASSTTATDAITNVASYRYKRLAYVWNHPKTTDPTTGLNITVRPESFAASYFAQTEVDVHPISGKASEAALMGVKELTFTVTRAQHILLKNAGIMAIDFDQNGIPHFASGVTTSVTTGEEEVVQRRMRDQIQLDLADLCAPFVGEKNSTSNRTLILSQIGDYLANKKANESIVSDYAAPQFISTSVEEAAGLAKILVRVKTLSHWIYLVIDTAIGPNVSIEESDTLPVAA